MSDQKFVHLNVHSDFSMLQASCTVKKLQARAQEFGMQSMALTDYSNVCNAVEFFGAFTKAEMKPIFGCRFNVAHADLRDKSPHQKRPEGYVLNTLAMNNEGYQSLCRLNKLCHLEGKLMDIPRVDKAALKEHQNGLIALCGGKMGEIAFYLQNDKADLAEQALQNYLEIYGKENFYIELQRHGHDGEEDLIKQQVELAKKYDVGLVATNDVHYLEQKDAEAHDVLLCIGQKVTIHEEHRRKFVGDQYYFRSQDEMVELFLDYPDAVYNSVLIAGRCNVTLDMKTEHYPVYDLEGEWKDRQPDYLRNLCIEAMKDRYDFHYEEGMELDEKGKVLMERLDFELGVIIRTGYSSYFLVVWDFIKYAIDNKIPVGPGRGSGAGSMVAYLLGITNLDPIHYNLLFERFLNPERISPPDFDIDFCERRRYDVIEYVRNKYGAEKVSQIGTYGTLKAKAVIKDVTRVLGYNHTMADQITKLIPDGFKVTLKSSLKDVPELQGMYDNEQWVQEIMKHSFVLEGLNRQMGIHACGVIIGDQDLTNLVPLLEGANEGDSVTQFAAGPCEGLGLLKMDFLGLRTLTIIDDALALIKKHHGVEIDIEGIPIDDGKTYKLFQDGRTVAVFQYESAGMQKYMKQLKPTVFADLIAMNALYRPGPIEYIPNFINRKHGVEEIEYALEGMDEYLGETYGITVYQEQVMLLAQKLAGFTKGEADTLRKAMGKKIQALLDELKPKFINQGSSAEFGDGLEHDKTQLEATWAVWEAFASYAFNKSHSTCYAWVAYQTAFLKAHYPAEFMAAVLGSELGNADKVSFFVNEVRELGIELLPPDIHKSDVSFTIEGKAIRFGMGAVKGVGTAASEAIVRARKEHGKFDDFLDFCEKVDGVNKRVIEALVKAGGFDCFGEKRSALFAVIEPALSMASKAVADRAAGQGSLFDMLAPEELAGTSLNLELPNIPEWHEKERLNNEKELLGFYATGHPLGEHSALIKKFSSASLFRIKQEEKEQGVRFGCMLKSISLRTSKRDNRPWVILTVEDLDDQIDVLCFSDAYACYRQHIIQDEPVFIEGIYSVNEEDGSCKVIANRILPINDAFEAYSKDIHIRIGQQYWNSGVESKVHELVNKTRLQFSDYDRGVIIDKAIKPYLKGDPNILAKLERYLKDTLSAIGDWKQALEFIQHQNFAFLNGDYLIPQENKAELAQLLKEQKHKCLLTVCAKSENGDMAFIEPSGDFNFVPDLHFVNEIRNILGPQAVHIKVDMSLPEPRKRRTFERKDS